MDLQTIIDAAEKATKRIDVKVKRRGFYAREGDLDDESIEYIDAHIFIRELERRHSSRSQPNDEAH